MTQISKYTGQYFKFCNLYKDVLLGYKVYRMTTKKIQHQIKYFVSTKKPSYNSGPISVEDCQ